MFQTQRTNQSILRQKGHVLLAEGRIPRRERNHVRVDSIHESMRDSR